MHPNKTYMRYTLSLFILIFYTNQSLGNDLEIQNFIKSYDKSNSIILDQISISASKIPMELKKTGSSVTIITNDEIENSNDHCAGQYNHSMHDDLRSGPPCASRRSRAASRSAGRTKCTARCSPGRPSRR